MTIQETKEFMERIKSYYQTFIVDTFTTSNWYQQLKEYSAKDINERLNTHLRSELYGDYVPKISFLLKGLRKENDPGIDKSKIFVRCNKCHHLYSLSDKQNHDNLCCDIDFFNFLSEKYTGKSIDKEKCFETPNFYENFKKALAFAISKESDSEEKERLNEILKVVELEIVC